MRYSSLSTPRRRIPSVLSAQPNFTLHLDHWHQPQPSYNQSVLGCFFNRLRTGRLKKEQALLLHGRKAQLKSRQSTSKKTTSTVTLSNTNIARLLLSQPQRLPIAIAIAIAIAYLSQLEAWCPAKFAILAEGSCNDGPISYARINLPAPGSQCILGQCKPKCTSPSPQSAFR